MSKKMLAGLATLTLASVAAAPSVAAAVTAKAAVRNITMTVPADVKYGTLGTGFALLRDGTSPVSGVRVLIQQKRPGSSAFTTVADDVTDSAGTVSFSFTSMTTSQWRAISTTAGRTTASSARTITSSAQVSWAGRPDLTVPKKTAVSYTFRVNPDGVTAGQVWIASAKTPTKWTKSKSVKAAASTGVAKASVTFPTSGDWLLKAVSVGTGSNSAGVTTTLEVSVS